MNIVKYSEGGISLDARIEGGQAWLTIAQTAELFGVDESTIREHAKHILDGGEIPASVQKFPATASDGKAYQVQHFSQAMVDAIGRRIRRNHAVKAARGVVYFIEAVGTGLVKVGKTHDLEHRLAALRTLSPVQLRLIKSVPGYTEKESELHARWAAHRDHGEWFKLAPIRREILAMQHETEAAVAG